MRRAGCNCSIKTQTELNKFQNNAQLYTFCYFECNKGNYFRSISFPRSEMHWRSYN